MGKHCRKTPCLHNEDYGSEVPSTSHLHRFSEKDFKEEIQLKKNTNKKQEYMKVEIRKFQPDIRAEKIGSQNKKPHWKSH